MKMTFRWYGEKDDNIPLRFIKQIPGCTGLMGFIDKAAGDLWSVAEIKEYVDRVHEAGLEAEVIESVNVHEDIKLGLPSREKYIENYLKTIENLASCGVKVIVYNFMPVFDWLRTDLAHPIDEDGSSSLYYDEAELAGMTPLQIVENTARNSRGFTLPGWEPERLRELARVLDLYKNVGPDDLRANYKYFLEKIIPTCEKCGVRMVKFKQVVEKLSKGQITVDVHAGTIGTNEDELVEKLKLGAADMLVVIIITLIPAVALFFPKLLGLM